MTKIKQNRVYTAIIGGLAGLVLTAGCVYNTFQVDKPPVQAVKSYDNHSYYISEKNLDDMIDISYKIIAQRTYKDDKTGREFPGGGVGTGFVVGEKDNLQYLITAKHVAMAQEHIEGFGGNSYSLILNKLYVEVNGVAYETDVVKNNEETDVSVIRTKKDLDLETKVQFAQLPLRAGDIIFAIGYPLDKGKFLSKGIITNPEGNGYFFYTSSALNPGNSGGPLFVFLNGEPKIAGLASFLIRDTQGMFGAIHYEHLVNTLDEALKEAPKEEPKVEPPKEEPKPEETPKEPEKPEEPKLPEEKKE